MDIKSVTKDYVECASGGSVTAPNNGSWISAYAIALGATEIANGSWLQTLCEQLGITQPVNSSWVIALANYYGISQPVNGSWWYAIADEACNGVVLPTAEFSGLPLSLETGNDVQYTDLSTTNGGPAITDWSWQFEGGTPASSTVQHPANVVFETPGDHLITLEVSNGFESFSENTTITVAPEIEAIFDWDVAFFDDDYQAPVTITMTNSSISATSYTWTFPSGIPSESTDETPTVTFNSPGTYSISLEADNGKRTHTMTRDITIFPDTNLRTFSDVELGINTAHNSNVKGAFFSTTLRAVFQADEITTKNGTEIDLAFFGLNNSFSFNKFVAPDEVDANGFNAIPNATHTKFINSQEICGCSASLTVSQFDAMTNDTLLDALTITETSNGLLNFDNSVLPRVVLLETADGRKGAIKIKGYVDDGLNSYIICDIKIQKE